MRLLLLSVLVCLTGCEKKLSEVERLERKTVLKAEIREYEVDLQQNREILERAKRENNQAEIAEFSDNVKLYELWIQERKDKLEKLEN